MNKTRNFIIGLFFVAVLIFILYTTWLITQPVPLEIQGEIEATQFRIASKIPGRIDEIAVKKGQEVQEGDFLFSVKSPEIEAKLRQATAARSAAVAMSMKAQHGAQEEDIQAAYSMYLKAEAAARLYEKTFLRVSNLFEAGVVAEQKMDEAETQMKAARQTANAAEAIWGKANKGARSEDKNAAHAMVEKAEGAIAEVESYLRETQIIAPAKGEISNIISERGELIPTGFPVITILDLEDSWATLFIREDLLADIKMGSKVKAIVPALGNQEITFEINYISPMADFATWTSTKSSGGFDMKSFEIHASPVSPVAGLRPGMSVLVNWKQFKNK
jgi:HlyD family secretion protein